MRTTFRKLVRDRRGLVLFALRLVVGLVFLYASADKVAHPDRFAEVVSDYELLPNGLVNAFAVCLPWVEMLTGVLLISGAWLPSAALLSTGMTAMFMFAIGANLARGVDEFNCGCFTTLQEGPEAAWGLLWRDGVLLLASAWLFVLAFSGSRTTETP